MTSDLQQPAKGRCVPRERRTVQSGDDDGRIDPRQGSWNRVADSVTEAIHEIQIQRRDRCHGEKQNPVLRPGGRDNSQER